VPDAFPPHVSFSDSCKANQLMMPIQPGGIPAAMPLSSGGPAAARHDTQTSFKNFLLESLEHVNSMQQDADRAVEHLMTGGETDTAEVLTAIQKADLTFRMMLQVRNKLVQAYQEINQIRI
jgi:flagellar hook-basal body complex protein FliE